MKQINNCIVQNYFLKSQDNLSLFNITHICKKTFQSSDFELDLVADYNLLKYTIVVGMQTSTAAMENSVEIS